MSFSFLLPRCMALALGVSLLGCTSLRYGPAKRYPSRPAAPTPRPESSPPATPPPQPPTTTIREELDATYGHGGREELHLDLYAPKDARGPLPAIVLLHGGGWCSGSKDEMRPAARGFAERGYITATVQYRLSPQYHFPAPLHDVKCAIRWLRAHADRYGIDPEHIGILGGSAGGHLALLAALTEPKDGLEGEGGWPEQSSRVQAAVNLMGPVDFSRPGWPDLTERMIAQLVGGSREKTQAAYRSASPFTYIHRGAPPVLTIHGTKDTIVPYEQAQLLHESLRAAGVTSWLEPVKDKGHGGDWSPDDLKRCVGVVEVFLAQNLPVR